jgi:hypothetical protein
MPRVTPAGFQFCGPSYLTASPVIDCQRSINLYPEPGISSSKTRMGLVGRPGLTLWSNGAMGGTCRALWTGNNRVFAVGGTHFYELKHDGTVITDYGAMAGISVAGPCQIIQNGGSTAFSLCVCAMNAIGGGGSIWTVIAGVMAAVFTGTFMEYLDGFQISIASGAALASAGNPNQINASAFGDVTTWDPLNYVIRTGASDLVKGLAVLNSLLYIFGARTTEVWYDAGSLGWPFARANGGQINLGCLSQYTIAKFYNSILWLGSDATGYAQVYMLQGMNPVKVSSPAIEYMISLQSSAALVSASAWGYQEAGHTFYVLNFGDVVGTPTQQYVYDLTTGLWHERLYGIAGPWPNCLTSVTGSGLLSSFPNTCLVGDAYSANVYQQTIQYGSDAGVAINYIRTSPHVTDGNEWHKYTRFEVSMQCLNSNATPPQPTLDYSDDGGQSFGARTIPLLQAQNSARAVSASMRRFFAMQLGRSRDRVFKLSLSDSHNQIRIENAFIDVDN